MAAKVFESVVLHRPLWVLEGTQGPYQDAYPRDRMAKFHFLQVYDFFRGGIKAGSFFFLAAVGIDVAFDNVPHEGLAATLKASGADCSLCRYVAMWLHCRKFSVKPRAPAGLFFSGRGTPPKGLP